MNTKVIIPAAAAALTLVPAAQAAAFYCGVPNKPVSAGMADEEKVKETPGGLVVPGAFAVEDGVSIFIRGGDKGHTKGTEFKSLGSGNPTAISAGNLDHKQGITDVLGH